MNEDDPSTDQDPSEASDDSNTPVERNDDPSQESSRRTESTDHGPRRGEHDVISDPALDEGHAADWTSEGGATPAGPATHVSDDE